jgi:hypothetical protein
MTFNTNFFDITKGITLLVICFLLTVKVWNYDFNRTIQNGISESTVTMIADNIVKNSIVANNEKLNSLIDELRKSNNKALVEAIKSKDDITAVGEIVYSLKSDIKELKSSFLYKDNKDPSKDVDFTQVQIKSSGDELIPIADIYYSPNIEGDDKWVINNHPLSFHTTIIETETEDGLTNKYTELTIENKRIPSLKDKRFPIGIDKVIWEKREIKDKKFMLNYRVSFGASINNRDVYPNIGISLFSYGRTIRDMDWRFVEVNFGGNENDVYLGFVPVSYNAGIFLPLVENLFIGPNISINSDIDLLYGGSISVPF